MNYYRFTSSPSNIKQLGAVPQLRDLIKLGDYEELESQATEGELPDSWRLPVMKIHPNANLTTRLSGNIQNLVFLVLKVEFIDFLNDFVIPDFKTWKFELYQKEEIINNYFLFHISKPFDEKLIDYQGSQFFIGNQAPYEDQSIGEPVNIDSYEDYLQLKTKLSKEENYKGIQCPSVKFDFSSTAADMIRFSTFPYVGYYVSERLRDAILEREFTGIGFEEIK